MSEFQNYITALREKGDYANQHKQLLTSLEQQNISFTRDEFLEHVASFKEIEYHRTLNEFAQLLVHLIEPEKYESVIDPCCGTGNILYYLQNYIDDITGIEINANIAAVTEYFIPGIHVFTADALQHPVERKFDLVVGNIPWRLKVEHAGRKMRIEEAFVRKSLDLVTDNGRIVLVVPYSFLYERPMADFRLTLLPRVSRIVGLPAGAMRNSMVKTALLFIDPPSESQTLEFALFESMKEIDAVGNSIEFTTWPKANLEDRWDPDFYLNRDHHFYDELEAMDTQPISELATLINGVAINRNQLNESEGILYLKPLHIGDSGIDLSKKSQYVRIEQLDERQSRAILAPGDIVMSRVLNDLRMFIYKESDPPAIASQLLVIIRGRDNDYIKSYLNSRQGREAFAKQAGDLKKGLVIPSISLSDIGSILIPMLPLEELNQVGDEHIEGFDQEELLALQERLTEMRAELEQVTAERDRLSAMKDWMDDRFGKIESRLETMNEKLDSMLELLQSLSQDFKSIKSLPRQDEEKLFRLYKSLDKKIDQLSKTDEFSIDNYIEEIKQWLHLWEALDDASKKFLPIAEFIFDELSKLEEPDFSPFVVQYCRSLENEILIKLFRAYHEHLLTIDDYNVAQEEFALDKVKLFATMVSKDKRDYTLGTMNFIMSMLKDNGNTLKKSALLQHFKAFALSYFEHNLFEKEYLAELAEITSDFRNKAAHPSIMSLEMALKCQELVRKNLNAFLESIKEKE
ncbi:MAG: hypothetical protein Salg2KO_04240 [Salibacteraceae bacterium]